MKGRPGMFFLSEEALLCQVLRKKKLHVKRPDLHSYFYIQLIKPQGGEAIQFFHVSRSSSPFLWIPGLACILNSYCARQESWCNTKVQWDRVICALTQLMSRSVQFYSAFLWAWNPLQPCLMECFLEYLLHNQTIQEKLFLKEKARQKNWLATAAASLQSCPTVRPQRRQPTRLPGPWDSPGNNTGVGCHFLLRCMKVKSESEVAQSCPTPSDPMDCSLPGSSVPGILQARTLEWGAIV